MTRRERKKKSVKTPKRWQFPSDEPEQEAKEEEDVPNPNEHHQTTTETESKEEEMQDPFDITPRVQWERDLEAPDLARNKRFHISNNLDSNKENGANT